MTDVDAPAHPVEVTHGDRIIFPDAGVTKARVVQYYGYAQHAVAPYSLRARPTATVAVPMDWDEVTASSFDPGAFRIDNVFHRLGRKRDPWADWGDVAHRLSDLGDALDQLPE